MEIDSQPVGIIEKGPEPRGAKGSLQIEIVQLLRNIGKSFIPAAAHISGDERRTRPAFLSENTRVFRNFEPRQFKRLLADYRELGPGTSSTLPTVT